MVACPVRQTRRSRYRKPDGAGLGRPSAHAGIGPGDVDGIYAGVMNSGFQKQDFQAASVASADPASAYVPATRSENACATGSAASYAAMDFIEAGRGRVASVVGAEEPVHTDRDHRIKVQFHWQRGKAS
ncbi:hypothetical protein OY671_008508, partial [Metschnikowia pulcherrima]